MKVIVAGGGSGGHITPNIAIVNQVKELRPEAQVLYVGSKGGMEEKIIKDLNWKFAAIYCGKLRRYFSWQNFLDVFKTAAGIMQSLWIVASFRPDVIFCKGGYVSLPMAIAGGILRKPVIIHESDAEPGLANKLAAHFAKEICVSFEETKQLWKGKKFHVTGNPVREELKQGKAEDGWKFSGLNPGKPVVLVMGGGQGAQFINEMIWHNLPKLLKNYQVIHLCGKGKERADLKGTPGYFSSEFIGAELKDLFAITNLVVSRAGANSLAEFEFLGLPAVLVPLVVGSRGDQITNARIFAKVFPAEIIDERQADWAKIDLISLIDKLAGAKVGGKDSQAARKIAQLMIKYAEAK
jgi:UDP-N-acetylglucosamine--N-acetylmuramyl-(pentapeptide) pyrophosphoryl-undecaprenol N-acetylglucosamine transferase